MLQEDSVISLLLNKLEKLATMFFRNIFILALTVFLPTSWTLDRRPTISFITQPEIVADIGGTVEMLCSVQYAQDYPVIWMKLDGVDRNNDLVDIQ